MILLDGGRKAAEHLVTAETDLLAHFRNVGPTTDAAAAAAAAR